MVMSFFTGILLALIIGVSYVTVNWLIYLIAGSYMACLVFTGIVFAITHASFILYVMDNQ